MYILYCNFVKLSIFSHAVCVVVGTFDTRTIDNMKLPIHRWYRYSAGFSADWVEKTISDVLCDGKAKSHVYSDFCVLDPFAGSGTTLLAADKVGVKSIGFESHPFVSELAQAKLLWHIDVTSFRKYANETLALAKSITKKLDNYPNVVLNCYSYEQLEQIDKLKYVINQRVDDSDEYKLSWLAFVCILRATSHAGTAQWQYLLPKKTKTRVQNVFDAFSNQIELMCYDISVFSNKAKSEPFKNRSIMVPHDARVKNDEYENKIDLVITSPPYANNYDYADATRLELCVLGKIDGWSDLQETVRKYLIRSSTQHVSREQSKTFEYLDQPTLSPIKDEIFRVCRALEKERSLHGGKKNYHTMIALYFLDLSIVWQNLRFLCKSGANVCFVIGDSAPYGIYVPVDEWLSELALASGFESCSFVKTRDRNVKWKNRKHNVPLKEGQLWVKG